ncbi:hypothetical protein NBRC116596_18360 [Litorivita sp. NS0012-18]
MRADRLTLQEGVTAMDFSTPTFEMNAPDVLLNFPSGEFAVRKALAAILSGLEFLDLDTEERGTVELVLAEVLNNVVEHAYGAQTPGWIEVACAHRADGLHFAIRDEGKELPKGSLPIGKLPEFGDDLAALPEGGFGWFLIQDLAKDVVYRRVGNRNTLTLRISICKTHTPN